MLEVYNLALVPNFFDNVFDLIYQEWGNENPNFWKNWLKACLNDSNIPSTFVVLDNGNFVGTFSIWVCDLQSRQDLYPWVGGVAVAKLHRGKGIGRYIQDQIKKTLREMNVKVAYLYTKLKSFYEKTGWLYIDDSFDEKDEKVRLYKITID